MKDTTNALVSKMKMKQEADRLDTSTLKHPPLYTILPYELALRSMPDLVMQACQPKNTWKEACITSICSMLSFICAILESCSYLAPSTDLIPEELRFDESKATDG